MNKYCIGNINILKNNVNSAYKQSFVERNYKYLCYLYLIKIIYGKFKKDSWKRFICRIE